MSDMLEIELLHKPDCPLCDEVDELLFEISLDVPIGIFKIDITEDPELEERYGDKVPVVRFPSGRELAAPLTEATLRAAIVRERSA